jgi:Mg2+/Co2+ transporter CorB
VAFTKNATKIKHWEDDGFYIFWNISIHSFFIEWPTKLAKNLRKLLDGKRKLHLCLDDYGAQKELKQQIMGDH